MRGGPDANSRENDSQLHQYASDEGLLRTQKSKGEYGGRKLMYAFSEREIAMNFTSVEHYNIYIFYT